MNIEFSKTRFSDKDKIKIEQASDEIVRVLIDGFFDKTTKAEKKPDMKPTEAAKAESIPEVKPEPQHKKEVEATKIFKNGLEFYSILVECGSCGAEGSRLTLPTNSYVKCSKCQQKLEVQQMFPEYLRADNKGFAFYAHAPYVTEYERYKLEYEMSQKQGGEEHE